MLFVCTYSTSDHERNGQVSKRLLAEGAPTTPPHREFAENTPTTITAATITTLITLKKIPPKITKQIITNLKH